jgi:hypothetical protein
MQDSEDHDAIWTPEAKAKIHQEFGWGGAALLEKYNLFLDQGGWAQPDKTVAEAFAEWARKNRAA